MRDIKFRVWQKFADGKSGFKRIPEESVGTRCAHLCMSTEQTDFCSFIHKSTENRVYQQWTGLKDKNGKDIYEGDIVQVLAVTHKTFGYGTSARGRIEFCRGCFSVVPHPELMAPLAWFAEEDIEIKGHIYEGN